MVTEVGGSCLARGGPPPCWALGAFTVFSRSVQGRTASLPPPTQWLGERAWQLRSSLLWGSHRTQRQQGVTQDPALQPDALPRFPVTLATPWPPAALHLSSSRGPGRGASAEVPFGSSSSPLLWALALLQPACRGAERVSLARAAASSPQRPPPVSPYSPAQSCIRPPDQDFTSPVFLPGTQNKCVSRSVCKRHPWKGRSQVHMPSSSVSLKSSLLAAGGFKPLRWKQASANPFFFVRRKTCFAFISFCVFFN